MVARLAACCGACICALNDQRGPAAGGGGSTLIAAEQMDRKAFLMEIDPLYCDVIVKRWEEFTGRHADLESLSVQPSR